MFGPIVPTDGRDSFNRGAPSIEELLPNIFATSFVCTLEKNRCDKLGHEMGWICPESSVLRVRYIFYQVQSANMAVNRITVLIIGIRVQMGTSSPPRVRFFG